MSFYAVKFKVLHALLLSLYWFLPKAEAQIPIAELTLSAEFSPGSTFPNFVGDKNDWNAKLYAAGAFSVLLSKRLSKHWDAVSGIGMSAYRMNKRGKADDYLLDFSSPHLLAGIAYYKNPFSRTQSFIKLITGSQLGYNGIQKESYEQYTVNIKGKGLFYFFLRPEIGIHMKARQKLKGSSFYNAFELSAYYRFNFKSLGEVNIIEAQTNTQIIPRGNIIGLNFRYVMPPGKKRLKEKMKTPDKRIRKIQNLN